MKISQHIKTAAIVPVFNVEKYLEDCLSSLLRQTFPFNLIILIDDGSTDGSGTLCDDFAKSNDSIIVVHKENEGLGLARNTGLEHVPDDIDFVMFVDSDDWLELDAHETLTNCIDSSEIECVTSGFVKRNDHGRVLFTLELEDKAWHREEIIGSLIPRICGSSPSLSDSIPMSVCATLFKKSVIDDADLKFVSEREVISEDFDFKVKFLSRCSNVVTSSALKYNYRFNPESLSTSYRPDRFNASLDFYDYACELASSLGVCEECKTRLAKTMFIYVRSAFSQERSSISGLSFVQSCSNMAAMLCDRRLRAVVDKYPVNELGCKQRIFIICIRLKMVRILCFAAELGLLR